MTTVCSWKFITSFLKSRWVGSRVAILLLQTRRQRLGKVRQLTYCHTAGLQDQDSNSGHLLLIPQVPLDHQVQGQEAAQDSLAGRKVHTSGGELVPELRKRHRNPTRILDHTADHHH